mgnify:CR=1 FL=1
MRTRAQLWALQDWALFVPADAAAAARGPALLLAGGLALGDEETLALRLPQDAGALDLGGESLEQTLLGLAFAQCNVQGKFLSRHPRRTKDKGLWFVHSPLPLTGSGG